MGRFKVMGNRLDRSGVLLEEFESLTEAKRWLDGYTSRDMGGYHTIEVVEFTADCVNVYYSVNSDDNTVAFNSSQR